MLLLLGLGLRLQFSHQAQLYPDEFVTLLAGHMITQTGWPVMPSGLFYEHGLLFSYLGAASSLFGDPRWTMRYVSLMCGLLTLGLTYYLGQRYSSPATGLIATAGLVIAPVAIHWSGRARMYALLQLFILLTLWLMYEGLTRQRPGWRWLALLAYLGAVLSHFVAVTIAPPLVVAGLLMIWSQRQKFARRLSLEALAFSVILLIAFLIKRAGQPKGIEALDSTNAATGIVEVFAIYSDFSFNLLGGWQAISPFYLTLPAILFLPFALYSVYLAIGDSRHLTQSPHFSTYLTIILTLTTLEMILLVSPDRRDDKYLFMLLPVLMLLGGHGLVQLSQRVGWTSVRPPKQTTHPLNHPSSIQPTSARPPKQTTHRNNQASVEPTSARPLRQAQGTIAAILPIVIILALTWWPTTQALLHNTGDDYDNAFAYVQANWQPGDTILTGTPAAAFFYLGRNDFYSVQRRGGYDYRILTVDGQPVDRWLASPAIRTEAALHDVLANHRVWLVLERWGLQREYYDLPFQQQLLAQTDYQAQAQGIFILRAKANPQPIALEPAHFVEATFGQLVRLHGYTVDAPGKPATPLTAGQTIRLTLYWQALAPIPDNYTVFVHLRPANGEGNLAQADHRPLGDLYPMTIWPVGEIIRETSELALPPDLPAGEYELWVGLYHLQTGERLPLQHDTSGENAVRLSLEVQ